MIKSDVFTSIGSEGASFLPPDSELTTRITEKEKGGIALSDPSQGISVHDWVCLYEASNGNIYVKNLNTVVTYTVLTGIMNVTDLSFAFDSNMRVNIGYKLVSGESKIYYYNSITEDFTTDTLPSGAGAPRLCHDDKRDEMVVLNVTDVLIFYIYNNKLYYLLQRERFLTPHQVATVSAGTVLDKVGMSDDLRILAQISNGTFVSSP